MPLTNTTYMCVCYKKKYRIATGSFEKAMIKIFAGRYDKYYIYY